ncbi:hypothetical protein [Taibaiella chishuiensis]|uniref:Uncharacterized protein n=1 Tax=Taibaiella chishuiensis TaxID=1434707 RepID=A0A2P8D5U7_9BACT|nr:hypothetical protein [Taibaiella chishuiensis]PSK92600.1 hypothetical protein B0I18_103177 [Taibaiella chishuiensis]
MALTLAQVAQILTTIQPVVDNSVYNEVKLLLNNAMAESPSPGETYDNIRQYSINLRETLVANASGICHDDPNDDNMAIFMDRSRVQRLLNKVPTDGYIAALPGIHTVEGIQKLTVSLLASDNSFQILDLHCNGQLHGEETWKNTRTFGDLDTVLR